VARPGPIAPTINQTVIALRVRGLPPDLEDATS
jgi:hypothetical protein